ncbi:MAG: TonB-dependent receptor [Pseudomonadota bacterium]
MPTKSTKRIRLSGASLTAMMIGAASICLPATQAMAQEADDEIVVTGSFIKRKNQADLPSPLQTIGANDINDIGALNIGDITQTLTINTGAQNNPDAFTQNATTGTSNINLRGLGVGSTLVLLNGRRQVLSGAPTNDGINFVDTNSLVPMIAIEQVDILKDGATALYGSDAVAGVVNFITRENFDGILLSGNYLTHQSEGDYDEFNIQGLIGKDFGRGSILLAASYVERSPLTTAERRLSQPANDTSALGNPGAFFTTAPGSPVPGIPAGTPLIDPGCAAAGGFPLPASATAPPPSSGIGFCGFDFGSFFNLVAQEERFTGFARAEVDLTDTINFSAEFGYANNETVRGNSPSFPFLQLGSAVVPGAAFGPLANPFNIFPGDPTLIFFGRAFGNGGEVSDNLTTSETWRFSTAVGGDIGSGAWEISFTRASNDFTNSAEDTVRDRFSCALSGFQSTPAVPGLTGGTDCTSANPFLTANGASIPAVGTFFNPFSTSFNVAPNDPALGSFLIERQLREYFSDLTVIEGFISQDLFELPAGPLSVAVGAQYRDNDLRQQVDGISAGDGFSFLVGGRDFEGSQDVFGFFAEAAVPLTAWADLQLAVRHERYGESEGGSTTDPKVALLVRPLDTLSLRASYSQSFRAPSVFQQFGESTTLQQVVDPLNGVAFVAIRTLAPEVNGEVTARPLVPEESQMLNVGGTWQPVEGLQIDLDYFSFDFENVIIQTAPQAIINANPLDPAIIRAPSATGMGPILQVNNDFVNASSVDTSGLDFSLRYAIEMGSGTLTPSFTGTYVFNYQIDDPQAGEVSGEGIRNFTNFGSPSPELRFNAGLQYENGPHGVNIFVRHIGSYLDDQNALAEIGSDTRLDVQYSLAINEFMNRDKLAVATVGVRNATGTRAPFVATNGGFDSRVADPRGALLYFGLDLQF